MVNFAESRRPPKVFVSYSHGPRPYMDRVLALSDGLRRDGVDAEIDQYEPAPPEGWPLWSWRQIESADYVLWICTEEGGGKGRQFELFMMTQKLYDARTENSSWIPVIFDWEDEAHIPTILRGAPVYNVGSEEGYEQLYRRLTNQPKVTRPLLGALVALPPRPRVSELVASLRDIEARRRRPWLGVIAVLASILAIGGYTLHEKDSGDARHGTLPAATGQELRGEILDDKTGLPLADVRVSLPEFHMGQTTDRAGQYHFRLPVAGWQQVRLRATRQGYETINADPPAGSGFLNTYRMSRRP